MALLSTSDTGAAGTATNAVAAVDAAAKGGAGVRGGCALSSGRCKGRSSGGATVGRTGSTFSWTGRASGNGSAAAGLSVLVNAASSSLRGATGSGADATGGGTTEGNGPAKSRERTQPAPDANTTSNATNITRPTRPLLGVSSGEIRIDRCRDLAWCCLGRGFAS